MGENLPSVPGGAQLHRDPLHRPVRTFRVKMVLLGGSGVGKSSLALRFGKDEFRSTAPTVGCAYLTRVVHLSKDTLRFEIWDTAGQEKYHSVAPLYYRGAHAALIVYDISKRETFIRAQMWLKELEKHYIPESTVIWLVGNKGDLTEGRQVSVQEGQSFANERGLLFAETSALSGDQIDELLQAVGCMSVFENRGELCPSGRRHHMWICIVETNSEHPAARLDPNLSDCGSHCCLSLCLCPSSSS